MLNSTAPGCFTSDEKGIIFIGSADINLSEAVGDIYHIDLEGGTLTNLTNTPDIHEQLPFVR